MAQRRQIDVPLGLASGALDLEPGVAALDERAVRTGNKQLVADHVAANWPCPGEAPMFVWNANIGLGFVSRDNVFARPKANVWLWRSARYQRAIYSLDYWLGVTDCEQDAVVQLEELAFGRHRRNSPIK